MTLSRCLRLWWYYGLCGVMVSACWYDDIVVRKFVSSVCDRFISVCIMLLLGCEMMIFFRCSNVCYG